MIFIYWSKTFFNQRIINQTTYTIHYILCFIFFTVRWETPPVRQILRTSSLQRKNWRPHLNAGGGLSAARWRQSAQRGTERSPSVVR